MAGSCGGFIGGYVRLGGWLMTVRLAFWLMGIVIVAGGQVGLAGGNSRNPGRNP